MVAMALIFREPKSQILVIPRFLQISVHLLNSVAVLARTRETFTLFELVDILALIFLDSYLSPAEEILNTKYVQR